MNKVINIIYNHLKQNKFDGLYGSGHSVNGCGCELSDLMPCLDCNESGHLQCEPAYKIPCDQEQWYCDCPNDSWHMTTEKPKEKYEETKKNQT